MIEQHIRLNNEPPTNTPVQERAPRHGKSRMPPWTPSIEQMVIGRLP